MKYEVQYSKEFTPKAGRSQKFLLFVKRIHFFGGTKKNIVFVYFILIKELIK
ncbi:hypothetical protein [Brachyspira aalborgi]|uniref:hypothetical protein n=1 Tax=Brachyspira aalborgi TaxID=29522 RepID=UPI002666152D|nr:hypothetical protein [Brachyspira aalborgi]